MRGTPEPALNAVSEMPSVQNGSEKAGMGAPLRGLESGVMELSRGTGVLFHIVLSDVVTLVSVLTETQ